MQLSPWASEDGFTSKYFVFFMLMLPDDVKSSLVGCVSSKNQIHCCFYS